MTTTFAALAASVADLTVEVETLRAAGDTGLDLAVRLDSIERDLATALLRVETLAALTAAPDPDTAEVPGYQFASLQDWVDVVFTRIAARHRAAWCARWEQHLDARFRLEGLWHTWESANSERPRNHGLRDEWTRVVFDHHANWLLDPQIGPFAGCRADLCTPAPRLTQRPLNNTGAVADLTSYRHRSVGAR